LLDALICLTLMIWVGENQDDMLLINAFSTICEEDACVHGSTLLVPIEGKDSSDGWIVDFSLLYH